jgi:23S rRNA (pseudouridine1915-N3)-methyltransferase
VGRPLVSHRDRRVRIVLVCIGRLRAAPFADDVAHYRRLLERHARIEVQELRGAGGEPTRLDEILRKEAEAVLARIPERAFVCALDREGEQLSSMELARLLEERRRSGRDLWFVMGGPFGLDPSVPKRADARLSLGSITLPHQLARVVLLEQLFRAHKILAGEPYHY